MVFEIVWTRRAVDSYLANMEYLAAEWTEKEVAAFSQLVEEKLELLSTHPYIGSPRSEADKWVRRTVLHKRVVLIYRVRPQKGRVELLHFRQTAQKP